MLPFKKRKVDLRITFAGPPTEKRKTPKILLSKPFNFHPEHFSIQLTVSKIFQLKLSRDSPLCYLYFRVLFAFSASLHPQINYYLINDRTRTSTTRN